MEILRKLRWVLYPSAFILVFIFGAYCTFPKNVLREMSENSLTLTAMGLGPKNRGLVQVSMKDVSLWRFSGVSLDGLKFYWPGTKSQSPMTIDIDHLQGRVGIFGLLTGSRSMHASGTFYGGDLDLDVGMRKKILRSVYLDTAKIDLGKMAFLESWLGSPITGLINMNIDVAGSSELSKDGQGAIKLNFDNLSYGPGSINLPAGGFVSSLTVPKINLGKLVADLSLDKGELSSKTFTLQGGDIEAEMKLNMVLGARPDMSKIDGRGWFSLKSELINSNETIKMLYDLIPELKSAQEHGGRVGLLIGGSIVRPSFRLSVYQNE